MLRKCGPECIQCKCYYGGRCEFIEAKIKWGIIPPKETPKSAPKNNRDKRTKRRRPRK